MMEDRLRMTTSKVMVLSLLHRILMEGIWIGGMSLSQSHQWWWPIYLRPLATCRNITMFDSLFIINFHRSPNPTKTFHPLLSLRCSSNNSNKLTLFRESQVSSSLNWRFCSRPWSMQTARHNSRRVKKKDHVRGPDRGRGIVGDVILARGSTSNIVNGTV